MGKDLYLALKGMDARSREDRMKAGTDDRSPWLFHAEGGGPIDYNKIYNDWSRAQKIAGVRMRSPHSLRHTYASVNLARGEDLAYISRQLGHANPAITLAIYTRSSRASGAVHRMPWTEARIYGRRPAVIQSQPRRS
jgi:integrase